MRRIILVLLSITICISCTSCRVTYLPNHSENFDKKFVKSFFENYSLADPQLSYFSASPWETEIRGDTNRQYLLSCVDETDPAHFVSVSEFIFFIGTPSVTCAVYQSKDAPTPMKDWTISSVSLLAGYLPFTPTDANEVSDEDYARKPMEYNLSVSEEIKIFSRSDSRDFLNFVAESYKNPISSKGRSFSSIYKYEEDGLPGKSWEEYTYYYLLVRFEENSNIVWLTQLYHDGTELYYSFAGEPYDCCALGSDYSEMILDLIGFEPSPEISDTYNDTAQIE